MRGIITKFTKPYSRRISRGVLIHRTAPITKAFGNVAFIRKILQALLQTQTTDDEGLATLLCEVEGIMNGRPITVVSSDSQDPEPLTPNHLLLLQSEPQMPPGFFRKEDSWL